VYKNLGLFIPYDISRNEELLSKTLTLLFRGLSLVRPDLRSIINTIKGHLEKIVAFQSSKWLFSRHHSEKKIAIKGDRPGAIHDTTTKQGLFLVGSILISSERPLPKISGNDDGGFVGSTRECYCPRIGIAYVGE